MTILSRRGLLRAASEAAPLGLIGPRVFTSNRIAIPDGWVIREDNSIGTDAYWQVKARK